MDDALELSVQDNEFDEESPKNSGNQKTNSKSDVKAKLDTTNFDPKDYISLSEAKQKLLENLEQYDLEDNPMLCSRGSVKSRLGVRDESVELMDYCESSDFESNDIATEGKNGSSRNDDSTQLQKTKTEVTDSLPRRPCMKNLCKRLRVRWHDSPVKIGREIAERLEEYKLALIIETVKVIGGRKALDLFNETKRVQLNGGLKTCNGTRRRTSGGVFFTLLKTSNYATDEQIKEIFKEDIFMKKESIKRKKAAYNKRKKARKILEQQANESNTCETDKQNIDNVQTDNDTMETEALQTDTNVSVEQDVNTEE